MQKGNIIRVAILDDDDAIRELLCITLNTSEGFKCVAAYKSCNEAIKNIENALPDILLLDIEMPGKDGIESLKEIKSIYPSVEIMMLTVYSDSEKIFQSLRAGAVGYLLKKSPSDKLLNSIREAYEGGVPFSGEIARKVLHYFQVPQPNQSTNLSERELEVLKALVDGHSTKAISEKLFVSTHTVRFHLHNIYVKLHVNSRTEAVAKALKTKLF